LFVKKHYQPFCVKTGGDEGPMFWPATQYWSMLFENVEKRWIISFYFKQAHSM